MVRIDAASKATEMDRIAKGENSLTVGVEVGVVKNFHPKCKMKH